MWRKQVLPVVIQRSTHDGRCFSCCWYYWTKLFQPFTRLQTKNDNDCLCFKGALFRTFHWEKWQETFKISFYGLSVFCSGGWRNKFSDLTSVKVEILQCRNTLLKRKKSVKKHHIVKINKVLPLKCSSMAAVVWIKSFRSSNTAELSVEMWRTTEALLQDATSHTDVHEHTQRVIISDAPTCWCCQWS